MNPPIAAISQRGSPYGLSLFLCGKTVTLYASRYFQVSLHQARDKESHVSPEQLRPLHGDPGRRAEARTGHGGSACYEKTAGDGASGVGKTAYFLYSNLYRLL